jgi:hypothetical protein
MVSTIRLCVVSLIAVAMAAVAAPQGARAEPHFPGGTIDIMVPQFVAEAVRFKALDISGFDWAGSDEVRAVFSDLNPKLFDLVTSKFEDVDTGETFGFKANERCIAPRPNCDHGVSEILHFKVTFWEADDPPPHFPHFCYGDAQGGHYWLNHGVCVGDDLIGRGEVLMSREQLLAELPRVGDSVEHKLILGGPCGPWEGHCGTGWGPTGPEYELTFRITRLDDVERSIVIAPPR